MYVHLANGDVKKLNDDEMQSAFGDGPIVAYVDNGVEYPVIGIYPEEVTMDKPAGKSVETERKK